MAKDFADAVGMLHEPRTDRLHGDVFGSDFTQLDQNLARAREALTGFRSIGDTLHGPVGHNQPRRTLNMDEIGVDRIAQPGNRLRSPIDCAGFNGCAVRILNDSGGRLATKGEVWVEPNLPVRIIDFDEIVRHGEQRNEKLGSSDGRCLYLRFIEPGHEAAGAVCRNNAAWLEVPLEEGSRLLP